MKQILKYVILMIIITSCGFIQYFGQGPDEAVKRDIASFGVQDLLNSSLETFQDDIESKLHSMHQYYVIGQKNLILVDERIALGEIETLFEFRPYLKLLAVRAQVEEIEHEIHDAWKTLSMNPRKQRHSEKKMAIMSAIFEYSKKSPLASLSMENIIARLHLNSAAFTYSRGQKNTQINTSVERLQMGQVEGEWKKLRAEKEFDIYEQNIEHLSHMLDIKIDPSQESRFFPSSTKAGNITGNEFPAKVWSLTFDDGPAKETSTIILQNLRDKNLKATFFQLTQQVIANPTEAKEIAKDMEIASHSYTHEQLTKVGTVTLEKEITQATVELKQKQNVEIKFFRLPYGAGVNTPHIREKIAENNLIHVFWTIDTLDWMAQPSEQIVNRAIELMKKSPKDAGVILLHDIHKRTTEAAPKIMDYLKQDNRRVCTLNEIVTQMNQGAQTVCPQL